MSDDLQTLWAIGDLHGDPLCARHWVRRTGLVAGDLDGALDEYRAFIDAAEEHDVPPAAYAEVRGNVGALLLKRGDLAEAAAELEASIALRDLATTRCNLAIIRIRQSDAAGAREHARAALRLGDESDSRTGTVARRILADVEVLEDQAK